MPVDPLAQFRRSPVTPAVKDTAAEAEPDDGKYRAFRAVDREPKRLSVRALGLAWVHATYSYLQYITEDAGRGRMFYIVYGFMVVEVRGRNLGPVVDALRLDNCDFIQQFDAGRWEKPGAGEPIIESIVFHHGAEKRGELLGDKQKQPKTEEV
jgi:hypothetical protein